MIEIHAKADTVVEYVFVQTKDDVEYQLIQAANNASNRGNWVVGECASRWYHNYRAGRDDGWFADQIDMSESKVYKCRRVWEEFGKLADRFNGLSWSHFAEALTFGEDAVEALEWAFECTANVAEMRAWIRAQRGHDLFAPKIDITPPAGEPPQGRALQPEKQNAESERKTGDRPARSGRAKRVSGAGKPARESEPILRADPCSDVDTPEPVQQVSTLTIRAALDKIESLIQLVVDRGSEDEREALLKRLQTVVAGLDPEHTTGQKTETVAASLAISNVVVKEWNMIDGVIQCRAITPKRRQAIAARMKDQFWKEHWREAIDKARTIDALTGRNDRNWRADLDWFLRPDTVAQLIEGKYDNWKTVPASKQAARTAGNKDAFAEVFGEERATIDDAVF